MADAVMMRYACYLLLLFPVMSRAYDCVILDKFQQLRPDSPELIAIRARLAGSHFKDKDFDITYPVVGEPANFEIPYKGKSLKVAQKLYDRNGAGVYVAHFDPSTFLARVYPQNALKDVHRHELILKFLEINGIPAPRPLGRTEDGHVLFTTYVHGVRGKDLKKLYNSGELTFEQYKTALLAKPKFIARLTEPDFLHRFHEFAERNHLKGEFRISEDHLVYLDGKWYVTEF